MSAGPLGVPVFGNPAPESLCHLPGTRPSSAPRPTEAALRFLLGGPSRSGGLRGAGALRVCTTGAAQEAEWGLRMSLVPSVPSRPPLCAVSGAPLRSETGAGHQQGRRARRLHRRPSRVPLLHLSPVPSLVPAQVPGLLGTAPGLSGPGSRNWECRLQSECSRLAAEVPEGRGWGL